MSATRQATVADPHAWLDRHIESQAAYYGVTPKQKADLFDGAAEFGELLEQGLVDEPSSA